MAASAAHPDPKAERITLEDLFAIEFVAGAGSRVNGLCIMTAAAWLAGEPHSDAPPCVSVVIRRLVIGLNDRMPDEVRNSLEWKSLAAEIVGTAPEAVEVKRQRAFAVADWAVRVVAPLALVAAGKPELAATLSGLAEVVDRGTALLARDRAREVRKNAADAAYAADAAADAAAAAAAAAYADDAAAYAAAAAAYAAAAAADDARNKMWAKIMETLVPLVKRLAAVGKPAPDPESVS